MPNAQIATKGGGVIEIAFEDILHWLTRAQTLVLKGPALITALTVLLQAVDKVVLEAQTDVSNPIGLINIPMDIQQFNDVKVVWADVKTTFKI